MFIGITGLIPLSPALAVSDDARYEACPNCEPKNLIWSSGQYDQIYLVPAQGGNSNRHPRALSAESLTKFLAGIAAQHNKKTLLLFNEESAANLAKGLAAALEKANAGQDVVFFITSRTDGGIFSPRLGNSGRAFLNEHGLNIIFGEANVDFFGAYKASRIPRPFDFGSRAKASKVHLTVSGVSQPRSDWVVIPLENTQAALPQPQSINNAAPVQAIRPATAAQPAAIPATAPALTKEAPPAKVRDESFYHAQEARLKGLKRLREQNLISEEEYQAKRKEILQDL